MTTATTDYFASSYQYQHLATFPDQESSMSSGLCPFHSSEKSDSYNTTSDKKSPFLSQSPLQPHDEENPSPSSSSRDGDQRKLFQFNADIALSRIRLFTHRSTHSDLKTVIWKKSHVIRLIQHDSWWFVYCRGWEGWLQVPPEALTSGALREVNSFQKFEDWSGRNYFLFNGKFMTGSDAKFFWFVYIIFTLLFEVEITSFSLTNLLITAPTILFLMFVLQHYPESTCLYLQV